MIVYVWPAAVIVPVRLDGFVFAASVYAANPAPDPDAPPVIVIHDAPLVAVHGQPAPVATRSFPVPPVASAGPVVEPRT